MYIYFSGKTYQIQITKSCSQAVLTFLYDLNLQLSNFSLQKNGKVVQNIDSLINTDFLRLVPLLKGGKGGYGAKLKTEGGKKVRPNDNMFSRDTQGQRVVYAAMQKQFKQFVKHKIQQDEKVAKQRQQFKIMQNTLKQGQSFMKLNKNYRKQMEQTQKSLCEAIKIGKQKLMQKNKLKQEQKQKQEAKSYNNQQQEGNNQLKRKRQYDEDQIQQQAIKKSKTNELQKQQIKQISIIKPTLSNAQQRFKLLFKK